MSIFNIIPFIGAILAGFISGFIVGGGSMNGAKAGFLSGIVGVILGVLLIIFSLGRLFLFFPNNALLILFRELYQEYINGLRIFDNNPVLLKIGIGIIIISIINSLLGFIGGAIGGALRTIDNKTEK